MRLASALAIFSAGLFAFTGNAMADVQFSPIEIQSAHPFQYLPAISTSNGTQLALPVEMQLHDGLVQRSVRVVTVGSMEGKTYAIEKPAELAALNKVLREGVFTPDNLVVIKSPVPADPGRLPARSVIVLSASGKNGEMIYLPVTTSNSNHSTEMTWVVLKLPNGARVDLAPFE